MWAETKKSYSVSRTVCTMKFLVPTRLLTVGKATERKGHYRNWCRVFRRVPADEALKTWFPSD
jgi:hypothetical protein